LPIPIEKEIISSNFPVTPFSRSLTSLSLPPSLSPRKILKKKKNQDAEFFEHLVRSGGFNLGAYIMD
jgi:hypothetical protein